jgi:hypothetical protein
MSEDRLPGPLALPSVPADALLIRVRAAELAPRRGHRGLVQAAMLTAGAGLVAAVILSGSPLPFLLIGPLMAGGLILARRGERAISRRLFGRMPLTEAAEQLPTGRTARLRGRVLGPLSGGNGRGSGAAPGTALMTLRPAALHPPGDLPAVQLWGQNFLMLTESGEKVAVLVDDGWLFDEAAAEEASRGQLRTVSVQPHDRIEVVGTVGRVVHTEGDAGLGRTPPSVVALGSTRESSLLVRKLT